MHKASYTLVVSALSVSAAPELPVLQTPHCARSLVPSPREFRKYPSPTYRGKYKMPDFNGPQQPHGKFRTMITLGVRKGPDFASYRTVVGISCGAGECTRYFHVDLRTGTIRPHPNGGQFAYHQLQYRKDSRLLLEVYQDSVVRGDPAGRCYFNSYLMTEKGLRPIASGSRLLDK